MSGGGHHDDGVHEEHEEHANHEAWVIPYADLLTLLMAMFIALFAMSTVDMTKFKSLAIGFNEALGGGKLDTGVFAGAKGNAVIPGSGSAGTGNTNANGGSVGPGSVSKGENVINALLRSAQQLEAAKAQQQQTLQNVEKQIQQQATKLGLGGAVSFQLEGRGLVVRVVSDQVLFDSGSATIKPEGQSVLRIIGQVLKAVDNPLLVEGHTDNVPISTSQFPSNWELSTARAGSVVRFLVDQVGLASTRMRPAGKADLRPIASNATAVGRAKNRRVEIVVQSTVIDQLLRGNDLTDASVSSKPAAGNSATPDLKTVVGNLANG
jgi:chemotaxis protein MotB